MAGRRHTQYELFFTSYFLFYSLDVASAKGFDLTAKLKISPNLLIVKYAETIYHSQSRASPLDNFFRLKFQIR